MPLIEKSVIFDDTFKITKMPLLVYIGICTYLHISKLCLSFLIQLSSSQESVHAEPDSNELTGSGLEADPVLISPEQHHHGEGVEVLLIRHPSVHYHGSDTFCDDEERAALQPHPPSPSGGSHEALEIEPNSDSESECSESNSLMSGSKTQSQDKLRLSSNLHDTSEV